MDLTNAEALKKIREYVKKGAYTLSKHAIERRLKRLVTIPEALRVLEGGRMEDDRVGWSVKHQEYSFAILGRTLSGVDIRVAVAIKEEELLIVSVIKPDKKRKIR